MVEKGVDVNIQNRDGNTALMALLQKDSNQVQSETVEFLIESGTDLNLVNKNKQNALFLVVQKNNKKEFDLIIEKNIINLNYQDGQGNTGLHFACLYRREKYAELLIKKDADLNIQNNDGKTPHTFKQAIYDLMFRSRLVNCQKLSN